MAKDRIDRAELADKLLEGVTSAEDPLRAMAEMIADFMMEAEVTAKIGAEAHERSAERTTYRNGFRDRRWDTRLGTLALKVPKLREGGYVPSFIEHRKRSEQALVSVIQEAVVRGVSTRKIFGANEKLTMCARKELPPLETALAMADTAEGPSSSAPAGARVPPRRWRRQDHPRQRRAAVSATARRAGTLTAPEDAGSKPHQRQAQVPRQ